MIDVGFVRRIVNSKKSDNVKNMELISKTCEKQIFRNISCAGQDLSHKEFLKCTFEKCDFSNCRFSGTSFLDCIFRDCNLSNVKVDNSSFQGVVFESCKLLGIVFSEVNSILVDWVYRKCNIALCDFSNLEMRNSEFSECDIQETDFINIDLSGSDFSASDIRFCRFQGANLEKTSFIGAKNYYIDPLCNKLKNSRFSSPEVLSLLDGFGIKIEY